MPLFRSAIRAGAAGAARHHTRCLQACFAAAVLAALVMAPVGAGAATARQAAAPESAQTTATIRPSLAPNRPGARTAATFTAHFATGETEGVPSPLRRSVVLVPAGLYGPRVRWPTTRGCSRAHLLRHGARRCPRHSQVGRGHALLEWREGSRTVREKARLWLFVAPTDGEYALEVLGEGRRPVHRRVVITESLFAQSVPYSAGMEATIPAIATRRGEPAASIVDLSLTMGSTRGRGGMKMFVPRSCPTGGFPWSAEFTYANGEVQHVTATVPCP